MDTDDPGAAAAPAPPNDPEVEAFDDVCLQLAGFDADFDAERADGYLTAVAASWRAIPVDEWLPALCGDAFERAFSDPHDVTRATLALTRRMDRLREALDPQALDADPDRLRLNPLMQAWDDAARQAMVDAGHASDDEVAQWHTGQVWAAGFVQATLDFAADWPEPREDDEAADLYVDLLAAVSVLMWDPSQPEYEAYARDEDDQPVARDQLIDEALFAAQDLRLYWLDHPPRIAPRRVEAAPGRNDPCPCGSGKKYKKCHGAAA